MFRFSAISRVRKLPTKRGKSTKSNGVKARMSRNMTEQERPTFIPDRQWQHTRLQTLLDNGTMAMDRTQTTFTIVSYNILAQDLLESHRDLYQGIPEHHLSWPRRKENLLREITNLRPDILCLQEMQSSHLEGFSAELLRRCTFDRVFKKRTGIEKTDGCAIFFNPDLFELLDFRTVEFNQQVALLDRDNIGIVAKLRSRHNPQSVFVVATTHLLFNPKRLDIKLAQVQVLLAELEQMAFTRNRYCPILLTGDFNMEPDRAPYSLIVDGLVDSQNEAIITAELGITDTCQHMHSLKYGRDQHQSQLIHSERTGAEKRKLDLNAGFEDLFNTGQLSHQLFLTPAYRDYANRCSTHHHDWIVVDYLFYSRYFNAKFKRATEGALKLLSYLELPKIGDCQRMERMPNEVIGSDHFSLAARFLLGSTG